MVFVAAVEFVYSVNPIGIINLGQTGHTQIKLLLGKQSGLALHCAILLYFSLKLVKKFKMSLP